MTGRELIIYILENNLEDKKVCENGKLLGLLTLEEAAEKFNVGVSTIQIWYVMGRIDGIEIDSAVYMWANAKLKDIGGDKC